MLSVSVGAVVAVAVFVIILVLVLVVIGVDGFVLRGFVLGDRAGTGWRQAYMVPREIRFVEASEGMCVDRFNRR